MMSTQGYFEHYRNNRGMPVCKKITTRPVIDRLTARHEARHKAEGFCLGAQVQGIAKNWATREWEQVTGQIWAKAPDRLAGSRHWWIVADSGATYLGNEDSLQTVGQAQLDEPLWESA